MPLPCPQCSDPDGTKEKIDYRWWFQCLVPGCDFKCQLRFYRSKFKERSQVRFKNKTKDMNYIEDIEQALEKELKMIGTPYVKLLSVYALLVLVKGENCTNENVHDAWCIW